MTKLNFDLSAGGHYQIPSSVTEEGSGSQFSANLLRPIDRENIYGIGLTYNKDKNEGGDFYDDQEHTRLLLNLRRNSRTLHTGFSESAGANTLELGSESSFSLWRSSGRFGVDVRPYFETMVSLPADSDDGEKISLLSLRAGVSVHGVYLEESTRAVPPGLSDYDVVFGVFKELHRFGRTYATAQALAGPSDQAQAYTNELFGEEGLPSARLENVGTISTLGLLSGGMEDGDDLTLQLRANSDQKVSLTGSKVIAGAAYFAMGSSDKSSTMTTQGVATGLGLGHLWIAAENRNNFVLYSMLLNGLAFAGGFASKNSKEGQALLQGSQQAMMSVASRSDQKSSHHLVYQLRKNSGRYVGYRRTNYLPSEGLYTTLSLLGQAVPGPAPLQQGADEITARDPLYEGAKAMAVSSLGLETKTGDVSWSAGARALLLFGEGPKPVPAVGAEQQMLVNFGNGEGVEVGVAVAEDLVNGEVQLSVSGVVGARF